MFGRAPFADLFWSKVERGDTAACWPWTGTTNGVGYGIFTALGHKFYAHRQAYAEASGTIPEDMIVRHRCDNPICCNPSHLEIGTMADNSQDAVKRGRFSGRNGPKGEGHGMALLSAQEVAEMRRRFDPNKRGQIAAAARAYNMSKSHTARILRGKSWASLPVEGEVH